MSTEENKAVVRRYYEEVFNKGNVEAANESVAADLVNHSSMPGPAGIEGIKQRVAVLHTAFPDLNFTFEEMIAEGDKVAACLTARGTHKGEFFGIPPTGKQIAVKALGIYRVVDGKIVEVWGLRDHLATMEQLGVTHQLAESAT